MFTGLIEALGTVQHVTADSAGKTLTVATSFAGQLALGESVAVNGTCLTVVAHETETCRFEVGPETLQRTNLGELRVGDRVNLERSLCMGDRLGGHWVQGHVDGIGRIERLVPEGPWLSIWFACPPELAVQLVPKCSVRRRDGDQLDPG